LVAIDILKVGNNVFGILQLDVVETVDFLLESIIVLLLLSLIVLDDTRLIIFKTFDVVFVLRERFFIIADFSCQFS
jgi:hypothetical protein